MKELSKLSTSTAGRLSPTPPTISLSPHSATHSVYICICTCMCCGAHTWMVDVYVYLHSGVHNIHVGVDYTVSMYKRTATDCPTVCTRPGVRLFIYLFIQNGSNARHFMNTILGASAVVFPKIPRESSIPSVRLCTNEVLYKSLLRLSLSLKVQSSKLVEG